MKVLVIAGEKSEALDAKKYTEFLREMKVQADTIALSKKLRAAYFELQMYHLSTKGYDVGLILLRPDKFYPEGTVKLYSDATKKYRLLDIERALDQIIGMSKGWVPY